MIRWLSIFLVVVLGWLAPAGAGAHTTPSRAPAAAWRQVAGAAPVASINYDGENRPARVPAVNGLPSDRTYDALGKPDSIGDAPNPMALSYYDAPGNGVATVAPIRLADQFITMDTDEGDNEDPLSLHKYIYASCNPVNRTDPSGHDSFDLGGMSFDSNTPNLEGGLLAAVGLMADPVSPWSINEIGNIDLNGAGMGDLATAEGDPNGFKVAYNGPQSTVVGDIIVYQIIGSSSYVVGPATRVDRGADYEGHAKPGRPLPPAMGAGLSGSSNTQYIDSPGGPGYWRCTAVAVSRLNGRDKLLSSYFFEFDNSTRRIIDREPNYTKDLKVGMKRWGVDTGVLDGL